MRPPFCSSWDSGLCWRNFSSSRACLLRLFWALRSLWHLSDVNLGHLLENEKNKNRVRYIQSKLEMSPLQSNVSINFSQEFHSYNTNLNGRLIAAFSNDFSKRCIAYLQRYGYKPTTAKLSQVVRWTSDDGKETWVPLYKVEFANGSIYKSFP